jgi:hypothetical protein
VTGAISIDYDNAVTTAMLIDFEETFSDSDAKSDDSKVIQRTGTC